MDNNYYNNVGNNGFNQPNPPQQERKGMAIASLIIGILSIPLGFCTGYVGVVFGIIGIFLGIFSKGSAPSRSGKAIAGIITGAVGLILGAIMLYMAFKIMADPEFMKQYQEILEFYNK